VPSLVFSVAVVHLSRISRRTLAHKLILTRIPAMLLRLSSLVARRRSQRQRLRSSRLPIQSVRRSWRLSSSTISSIGPSSVQAVRAFVSLLYAAEDQRNPEIRSDLSGSLPLVRPPMRFACAVSRSLLPRSRPSWSRRRRIYVTGL
jgi:hypothetical protein